MTCQEFRAMLQRSPLDCTTAERTAHHKHMATCADCRALVPTFSEEEIVARMGTRRFDVLSRIAVHDAADPESVI